MISKTLAIASALAVLAVTAAAMASDRDHEDRGTRLQGGQNASVMFPQRGGWDANSPDSAGALTTSSEFNLEAVELPGGKLLGNVRD